MDEEKNTPAAEVPDRRRGLPTLILIAIIAVICVVFAFLRNGATLPQYAPKGTDVIVYVNAAKITASPIYKELEKDPRFAAAQKDAAKELKEFKLSVADLTDSEGCIFLNSKGVEKGGMSGIARFRKSVANGLFDLAVKNDSSLKKTKLAGKSALTAKNGVVIALDGKTIQFSVAQKHADCIAAPLKPVSTDLARAVNTDAYVSIAYRVGTIPAAALEKCPENYRPLAKQIAFVTLDLTKKKADLQLALELTFKDEKAAAEAGKQLDALVTLGKNGEFPADAKELVANTKVAVKGKVVTMSTAYPEAKIVKLIREANRPAPAAKPAPAPAAQPAPAPAVKPAPAPAVKPAPAPAAKPAPAVKPAPAPAVKPAPAPAK